MKNTKVRFDGEAVTDINGKLLRIGSLVLYSYNGDLTEGEIVGIDDYRPDKLLCKYWCKDEQKFIAHYACSLWDWKNKLYRIKY